jgi:hypothetical protein
MFGASGEHSGLVATSGHEQNAYGSPCRPAYRHRSLGLQVGMPLDHLHLEHSGENLLLIARSSVDRYMLHRPTNQPNSSCKELRPRQRSAVCPRQIGPLLADIRGVLRSHAKAASAPRRTRHQYPGSPAGFLFSRHGRGTSSLTSLCRQGPHNPEQWFRSSLQWDLLLAPNLKRTRYRGDCAECMGAFAVCL